MALVVGTVSPLLLDSGAEGLVGIGELAAGGVLSAAPGVGDGGGETFGGGVLDTDLEGVGDDSRTGVRGEGAGSGAE